MKIIAIELENVRGFKSLPKTSLSPTINIFIGPNNAGKSTILNSIFQLQRSVLSHLDISIGTQSVGVIRLFYSGQHNRFTPPPNLQPIYIQIELSGSRQFIYSTGRGENAPGINESEPFNLIYPYLSKRKTAGYTELINEQSANAVTGNLHNIYSKIDRLIAPQFPGNKEYVEACENIFGFQISTLATSGGKQAVYYIEKFEHIGLPSMGEGVPNILGLVCDLCLANNQIFLIEEPENDVHPKALKALLKLIIEKSRDNQFFISTHSNIVMKYLGSAPESKLFHVSSLKGKDIERPNLFISSLKEVNSADERRQVLEDLGYDMFDFDMWSSWLFLEESSAERIIKDFLIPWFVKPLQGKLRTFSANGISEIEPKFEDFNKLFVFLHLEPTYKNKVWVLIDNGKEEQKIIERMRTIYGASGWNPENFSQFKAHDFERYYPKRFQDEAKLAIELTDRKEKREAKKVLLQKVINWIGENPEQAKKEFQKSASEIISILKKIYKTFQV